MAKVRKYARRKPNLKGVLPPRNLYRQDIDPARSSSIRKVQRRPAAR